MAIIVTPESVAAGAAGKCRMIGGTSVWVSWSSPWSSSQVLAAVRMAILTPEGTLL